MSLTHFDNLWYEPTTGCHIWPGSAIGKGYPQVSVPSPSSPTVLIQMYAHRYVYEQHNGAIPDGYEIDHLCGVPLCVNPGHLEAVTPEKNRQRQRDRWRASHLWCRQGHRFTDENTAEYNGRRKCRQCYRIQNAASAARRRQRRESP